MAAIAFNAAHQPGYIRGRLETVLTILREMLDAFVSHRMRLAATAAERARPRRVRGAASSPVIVR